MKISKIILAVMLCAVIAFVFTGCEKNSLPEGNPALSTPDSPKLEPIQDTTPVPQAGAEKEDPFENLIPLEEYGLTVENIYWSNLIYYILSDNYSVKTITYHDGFRFIEGYFNMNDVPAAIYTTIYDNGKLESYGYYDRYSWELAGDHVVANLYVEELEEEYVEAFDFSNALNYYFVDAEAGIIEVTDTDYVLFVRSFFDDYIITIDRQTLDIKQAKLDIYSEEPYVLDYIYNELVEGGELFDTWNGPKKNVTVVAELHRDGSTVQMTNTFEIAPDWELMPTSWDELAVYGNSEYTQPFEYPGFAKDYTVYATNAMG